MVGQEDNVNWEPNTERKPSLGGVQSLMHDYTEQTSGLNQHCEAHSAVTYFVRVVFILFLADVTRQILKSSI